VHISIHAANSSGGSYLVLDDLPDDPGHLIAVKFHHGVLDLDLLDSSRRRHPALSDLGIETRCGGGKAVCAGSSRARELRRSRTCNCLRC
jgi:hypothetical protein